jgi:hypothetical protein
MNQVRNPLFTWSLTLALLSGLLARYLLQTGSPVLDMSPGMQWVVAILVSLVPLAGLVLGVMSWKRKELKVGWSIVVIVLNAVQFLLVFVRVAL